MPKELKSKQYKARSFEELDLIPLLNGQGLYVMNYRQNEVLYQRKIKEVLGYSATEFDSKLINQDIFHPKQEKAMLMLIASAVKLGIEGDYDRTPEVRFILLYKAKHKSGKYISLLRQTGIFETDKKGAMISVYSLITDVSGVMDAEQVKWKLEGVKKNFEQQMKVKIKKVLSSFFTDTELSILALLKKGFTTKQMAEKLHNSEHTISTHRRNMLRKSNCKNARELLLFAESLGV